MNRTILLELIAGHIHRNREGEKPKPNTNLTVAQVALRDLREVHVQCEFAARSTENTLATRVADGGVNHIPVMTGGAGGGELGDLA